MSYFKTGQEWLHQSALLIQASPTSTKITTRYSIKAVKRRKSAAAADAVPEKPPRATLVLKTFDPVSGVTLKYRTTKAAEVSRLMGAAMGQLGRSMAALPEVLEEAMPDAAVADEDEPREQKEPQQQAQSTPAAGGGGGKKKKKGKK